MSKKGCSPDNAACEGSFGRMKTECFYNHSIEALSLDELKTYLSNYIRWYNHDRIKNTLGGLSLDNTGSDLVSISKGAPDFVRNPTQIWFNFSLQDDPDSLVQKTDQPHMILTGHFRDILQYIRIVPDLFSLMLLNELMFMSVFLSFKLCSSFFQHFKIFFAFKWNCRYFKRNSSFISYFSCKYSYSTFLYMVI